MDPIKRYEYEAHDILGETSVFEVLDKDREYAVNFLTRKYGKDNKARIEKYLKVVGRLREYFNNQKRAV